MGGDRFLGSFEELVLLAVARDGGNAYGMTVRREIERHTGREVAIGAVYATLDRLEEKGLVASRHTRGGAERSGRVRRHFRVRRAGFAALAAVVEMRAGLWAGVDLDALAAEQEGSS